MIKQIKKLFTRQAKLWWGYLLFVLFYLFGLKKLIGAQGADFESEVIGQIKPPPGVEKYNEGGRIGIFLFISQLIKIVTIVAGIWTMVNFILAGWIYLTSEGDSSAGQKVSQKITNSVVGLVIVALAYSIAALLGLIIFDDASFILNPTIETVNDL